MPNNPYLNLSPEKLFQSALEMAQEQEEKGEQMYALASAIVDILKPALDDEQCLTRQAYHLAQILEEMLSDTGQAHRLKECVSAGIL